MNKFTVYRQARAEISRMIKISDRWMFSVYDKEYRGWREYGPYDYAEAKRRRKLIFAQKVERIGD